MNDEPRYTLAEAKLELNKEKVTCDRCGRTWPVGEEEA